MSTRTKAAHLPDDSDQLPFKEQVGHLQSILLVILTLGMLEVGFLYSTLIVYALMTIAFYEMIRVQQRQDKEERIQIKTAYVEWYYFFCMQFYMVSKTWLTQDLLHNSGIVLPSFFDDMLFKYHSFYTFCLLAGGMILFVLSLEEGFYAYQFKQYGWSLLNLIVIVSAGHGHLSGMWRLRLWFVYTVLCMCLRDAVDNLVSKLIPISSPIHSLSPKATILGYIFGGLAAFAFYFQVANQMLNFWWFNVSPIKIGLAPFDTSAIHIDTSAALFKQRMNHWALGPLGDYQFIASPIQIHLFIVTCFVAMIAPFGSIFFSALKRALKTEQLGEMFTNGGVIDRVDCLLITGLFMFIYTSFIVYRQADSVRSIQDMILQLSPQNQRVLYERLLEQKSTLI